MTSHFLTTLAVFAIASTAFSQNAPPLAGHLQPATTPTALNYTIGEGYSIVSQAQRSGPETIFNNRGGYAYYFVSTSSTNEYVDEGSFPLTGVNGTEQANGMIFDYCSMVPDPGGNAVTAEIVFYEETIGSLGVTGWIDANNRNVQCGYIVAGLPGDISSLGVSCWTVSLNLAGGFECTLPQEQTLGGMNNFGWSATYFDTLALDTTGPFVGNHSGYGTQDYVEWYDLTQPLGLEYQGSIWWGGPPVFASFSMSLLGPPTDTLAYYSAVPGSADTVELQAAFEVRPGQAATWNITNPTAGQSYALIASTASVDIPVLVGGNAHLLVDWMGAPLLPAPIVMPNASYSQLLPAVMPPNVYVQAAEYAGALTPANISAMSNGLVHSN